MATIDETEIIDREAETASFAEMLGCTSPERVLVVDDKSGSGKSDLLRKLRLLCETRHEVPVALADCKDYESKPDAWFIVDDVCKDLVSTGADLPHFNSLNGARSLQRTDLFAQELQTVRGAIDLSGASISGGQQAGMIFNNSQEVNVAPQPWTDEAERWARALCIEAFLADLRATAHDRPVVLLFDTVDKANERLRRWLFQRLVRQTIVADRETHKVLVVMAGPGVLPMLEGRLSDEHKQCLASAALEGWNLEQVTAFLKAHKYSLPDDSVGIIYQTLQLGYTLQQALNVAATFAERDSRA
ncbi:MAG: hypothetical protein AB7Q42_13940 [Acidimicrobiia bacterium]